MAGMSVGVLLISNPVGWGVALVLGTATALGSYASGKLAARTYDKYLHQYDLVQLTNLDAIC
jgi:hypothetical protein